MSKNICKCGNEITENNKMNHVSCNMVFNDCCNIVMADVRNNLSSLLLLVEIIEEEKLNLDGTKFEGVFNDTVKQSKVSIDYLRKLGR